MRKGHLFSLGIQSFLHTADKSVTEEGAMDTSVIQTCSAVKFCTSASSALCPGSALDLDMLPLNQGLDMSEENSHRHKKNNKTTLAVHVPMNKPS